MRYARSSLAAASVLLIGALFAVTTTAAGAQQLSAPRFAGAASAEPPTAEAPTVVPRDSVAHYLHAVRVQRWSGGSLVAAGLAAVTVAYVGFARSGSMAMNGAQAATFVAGTALGAVGGTRWSVSRESLARATRWSEVATPAQR